MTNSPDSLVVTSPQFESESIGDTLVTPTGGEQQRLADALVGGGGSGITVTGDSGSVAGATNLSIVGAGGASVAVSGSTPDATVTVTAGGGGAGSVGPQGTGQASDGAGGFQVSSFIDQLTVEGSATATLVDAIDTQIPVAGLAMSRASISPTTGAGGGFLLIKGYGTGSNNPGTITLAYGGTVESPTEVLSGANLYRLQGLGYDGSGLQPGYSYEVHSESDFSGTPTSSIHNTNASSLGWHIAGDGTFSMDGNATSPALTVGAAQTTSGAQAGTITNAPTAGDPATFIEISVNGTTYAIPAWALS